MTVREPKKRSALRLKLGGAYFSAQRKLRWLSMRKHFARERSGEDLSYRRFPTIRRSCESSRTSTCSFNATR